MSSCCSENCAPAVPVQVIPCQEPLDCSPPPDCCEHCLLAQFQALYPSAVCNDGDLYKVCLLLHQTEAIVGGLIKGPQRTMAIMWGALHLLHLQTSADLALRAQYAAIAQGESPGSQSPGGSDFWSLSSWGLLVKQMIEANPVIGFMAI